MIRVKNFLYRVLWKFGDKIYTRITRLYLLIRDYKGREHKEKLGVKNPDKTIYLIRKKRGEGEGLLSVFTYIMGRIDFAHRNGYEPFVDVDEEGKPSVFNRYFSQKSNLSRQEVYESNSVILSGWDSKPVYPGWCNWINTNFNKSKKELFDKYIAFTEDVTNAADEERAHIRPNECLGLYLRGTDYTKLKPFGHPVQPSLEDVKREIDRILAKTGISRIFLVAEDVQIYRQVTAAYPSKVVVVRQDRFWDEYNGEDLILKTIEKHGDVEENNILYLVKIILLAECRAFVGGRTNGSVVANALNGDNYEDRFVYDVGVYS